MFPEALWTEGCDHQSAELSVMYLPRMRRFIQGCPVMQRGGVCKGRGVYNSVLLLGVLFAGCAVLCGCLPTQLGQILPASVG